MMPFSSKTNSPAVPLTSQKSIGIFKAGSLYKQLSSPPVIHLSNKQSKPAYGDYWKNFRHSEAQTQFGIDHFIENYSRYKHCRIGLVTNDAATTTLGRSSRKALMEAGFNLVRLFSPEHGIETIGIDGSFQPHSKDAQTGLPVISLYGDQLTPATEDLQDLELMLFDLPDAGTRFYTFLWTLTYVMEACARQNIPLMVLDRPNPISGNLDLAEGPFLEEDTCASFIGRWDIPIRHSCTLGELARYFAATRLPDLELQVLTLKNWNRNETTYRPGWHFVAPSPAMNTLATAYLYPGMGLLEGMNVCEGRGTPYPFHLVAAPWLQPLQLKTFLDKQEQEGYTWQFNSILPEAGPYEGQLLYGLQCHILNLEKFRPVKAGMELIRAMIQVFPDACIEKDYPTVANPTGKKHLDLLLGKKNSFDFLANARLPISTTISDEWKSIISDYLLY